MMYDNAQGVQYVRTDFAKHRLRYDGPILRPRCTHKSCDFHTAFVSASALTGIAV